MANQKQAKEIREMVLDSVATLEHDALDLKGRTSEGLVFAVGEDFVVVRAIVKSETFDADAEILAFSEKLLKAEEKAKSKEK